MLHEALMLEIYRQALNAGTLPTTRPRSTDSANSSDRCPSHESHSSENGRDVQRESGASAANILPVQTPPNSTFPTISQSLPSQPSSMEAYLHMVAAAAQQYGFPIGGTSTGPRLPLPLPTESSSTFKMPLQASPTASSNNSEALDFRTNLFCRGNSLELPASEEDEEEDDSIDANNPLDLSIGTRKRTADSDIEHNSAIGQIQVKKIFKSNTPQLLASTTVTSTPSLLPTVNPYLAAVAAANIFRSGQFPDWNGKSDLVVDPLEKISDIVKGPRKEKSSRSPAPVQSIVSPQGTSNAASTSAPLSASTEVMSKARHNIWQSHWQNKGVASSVFRCVWCKQSFSTLESLTTHMKDSKHCGVNVPPFGNLPNTDRHHLTVPVQTSGTTHSHNLRKQPSANLSAPTNTSTPSSSMSKNAFQYRGDPPTPLPRKLVRGQNVWLGKGVEQAMQILKCMRCGESFRSLGEMTKHMQETQHYTNILSQEQTISMKSSSGEGKETQNSLSSEESRTLSAVLTCKVCDKAFNSLGDLSIHMAKNNHYAEPLMQSISGSGGNRKRPAPKKREKSLPVRKLLEMKGGNIEQDPMEIKMQRTFENSKRMSLDGTGIGPGIDKSETALFAERMRQYISGVKPDENAKNTNTSVICITNSSKSPEIEGKNIGSKNTTGSSSVLSAIEQMFTTSFDTPPRHTNLPTTSPNSSIKNTSPVASSILKRLGIDETVDYNKPLMDTVDTYYPNYRYNSSDRSGSECSIETQTEFRKADIPMPEKILAREAVNKSINETDIVVNNQKLESEYKFLSKPRKLEQVPDIKMEIKSEGEDEEVQSVISNNEKEEKDYSGIHNGADCNLTNNIDNKKRSSSPDTVCESPSFEKTINQQSPTDSNRSITPKSPASSVTSLDSEKKYPSDSLNALSSMFDSLGSSNVKNNPGNRSQSSLNNKIESPENVDSSNSLAALRQFCVKKEKTT